MHFILYSLYLFFLIIDNNLFCVLCHWKTQTKGSDKTPQQLIEYDFFAFALQLGP